MLKLAKYISISILFISLLTGTFSYSHAQETSDLNIHLFHSKTCPHCIAELKFFAKTLPKYPNVKLNEYDIDNKTSVKILIETAKKLNTNISSVPFLVIGEDYILGYQSDDTTGVEIENKIKEALLTQPRDVVGEVKSANNIVLDNKQTSEAAKNNSTSIIKVPFIGNVQVSSLSLPMLTVLIGLLDGFNPCAMWVLLFLISLLIGMQDRKRMWILGGTFILVSGFMYYLFMAAWLNVFLVIGYASIVRYGIAFASLGIGFYYLRRYVKNKDGGCETADYSKKQQIFDKAKKAVTKEHLAAAVLGIAALAVAVNILELLCSAGLPAIYTKVLSMTPMPKFTYYLYLLGYVFFFMLDDLIVFIVAMVTFRAIGIESKYSRYSQLIGGLVMLALGIIMIVNPGLLTFANI
jgi:glutaredoxin